MTAPSSRQFRRLLDAIHSGDAPRVERLTKRWPVDEAGEAGIRALHFAVARGSLPVVEVLLSWGVPAQATDDQGLTPLALACYGGSAELVSRLIDAGAEVRPSSGALLGRAISCKQEERALAVMERLLAAGADPDDRADPSWETERPPPLILALERRRWPLALRLLRAGADPNVVDALGRPALELGVPAGAEMIRALLGAGARPATGAPAALLAAAFGDLEVLEILHTAGVDLDAPDAHGHTPLLAAAWDGHGAAVRWLLRRGARPETLDGEGRSAHTLALLADAPALADALAEQGAPIQPERAEEIAAHLEQKRAEKRRNQEIEASLSGGRPGKITSGAFAGLPAIGIGEPGERVKVMISVFGRWVEQELDSTQFQPDQ